jgi:hypothetical protein
VVGTAAPWVDAVEHEGGWRAECGYPQRILVPARRLHGAPVDEVEAIGQELAV